MAVKLAIANCKGGIGKSTTALNLADQLMNMGKRVLLIDMDPQRNSTVVYGAKYIDAPTVADILMGDLKADACIQTTEYGDIIAGDEILKEAELRMPFDIKRFRYMTKALKCVENNYDFIIFDTPPREGVLLGNVLYCCDYVIAPITCDLFGVQGVKDLISAIGDFREENERLTLLGLLVVKYKPVQHLTQSILAQLKSDAEQLGTRVFDTAIRESVKCQEAQTRRVRLSEMYPDCTTAADYKALTEEILKEINA